MSDYWDTYQDESVGAYGDSGQPVRFAFDPDEWASFPVAAIFETYREAYNLSIDDVAASLKIRREYLVALEQGDYDSLPGKTFAVGYVRSYANFLQLPAEDIVDTFKFEAYAHAAPMHQPLSIPEPPKERQLSRGLVALISLVLLTFSWGVWMSHSNGWGLTNLIPPLTASQAGTSQASDLIGDTANQSLLEELGLSQPEATILDVEGPTTARVTANGSFLEPLDDNAPSVLLGVPFPKLRPTSFDAREPEPTAQNEPSMPRVVVEASSLAWIQVTDRDGEIIVSRMLQSGDFEVMPSELGLTLSTGSIESLSISVDGQAVALPAPDPDVLSKQISLDPASLQGLGAVL